MRKFIALLLSLSIVATTCLTGCSSESPQASAEQSTDAAQAETEGSSEPTETYAQESSLSTEAEIAETPSVSFTGMDDPELVAYVENTVYTELLTDLNSDEYYVENVQAVYISQEYIDELTYNSQSNLYFGYTLQELDEQFQGERYIFTLGDDGTTAVQEMETFYDNSTEQVIKNVAVGGGVILICVTVSVVSGGLGAPAVSMIFAAAAETGTAFALSSAVIGGAAATITTGYQTRDLKQAFKEGTIAASEGFKWGAITGAVIGGGSEAYLLHGATLNGLTMNEAAVIQKATQWPLDAISSIHSTAEAQIYQEAGLIPTQLADGQWAFLREIDWKLVDDFGRSNVERVAAGLAPIDSTGMPYELHHIGMRADSPLAILTNAEHHSSANFSILHYKEEGKNVADAVWKAQKKEFWNVIVEMAEVGG